MEHPKPIVRIATLAVTSATLRARNEITVPFDVLMAEEIFRLTVEWAAKEISEEPFNAGAAAQWLKDQI